MTAAHDPLPLPCGQVLPNRLMEAAMSEALADRTNAPDSRREQLCRTWSEGASSSATHRSGHDRVQALR